MKKLTRKSIEQINITAKFYQTFLGHNFTFTELNQVRGIKTLKLDKCQQCGCTYDDLRAHDPYTEYYKDRPSGKFENLTCNEVIVKTLIE